MPTFSVFLNFAFFLVIFWPSTVPLEQRFWRCFSVQKINTFSKSYFFIFKNYCPLKMIIFTPVWVTFIKTNKKQNKTPGRSFSVLINDLCWRSRPTGVPYHGCNQTHLVGRRNSTRERMSADVILGHWLKRLNALMSFSFGGHSCFPTMRKLQAYSHCLSLQGIKDV